MPHISLAYSVQVSELAKKFKLSPSFFLYTSPSRPPEGQPGLLAVPPPPPTHTTTQNAKPNKHCVCERHRKKFFNIRSHDREREKRDSEVESKKGRGERQRKEIQRLDRERQKVLSFSLAAFIQGLGLTSYRTFSILFIGR